jgi:hypothetical protein
VSALEKHVAHIIQKDPTLLEMSPSKVKKHIFNWPEFEGICKGPLPDIEASVEDVMDDSFARVEYKRWITWRRYKSSTRGRKPRQMVMGSYN